jgi:hypothetical protein
MADKIVMRPVGDLVPSLSPKQARFVEEYLIDLNAKQAANPRGLQRQNGCGDRCPELNKT